MTNYITKLLFFLTLWTLALANDKSSDVIVLTSQNFEHLTQASSGMTTGSWLVEFYAPWCGHCKKLAPDYEKVATALKGEVNVAKVDVPDNQVVGKRFNIKGFPTILLLKDSIAYKYTGERTVDGLTNFATKTYMDEDFFGIPPEPSFFGDLYAHFEFMRTDFYRLLPTKRSIMTYVFAAGGVAGLLLGCICGACCCGRRGTKSTKTKKNKKE